MNTEPYRALFPLGLLWGCAGVALWLLHFMGIIAYPILPHAYIMIFGFFMSFVSGFLMTALPRMTGTFAATRRERDMAMIIIVAGVVCSFLGRFSLAYGLSALQVVFLVWFGTRRPHSGKGNRPAGFIFIPAALLWVAFGAVVQALHFAGVDLPPLLVQFGRVAVQEAFLLNLIVGIGSKLIPFLTRIQNVAPHEATAPAAPQPFVLTFALLNLSFVLEAVDFLRAGWALRAVVLAIAAVSLFKLHVRRTVSSHLGTGLFTSIIVMIAGYALLAVFPVHRIALLHLVFIGGFSMITLMVATRVVLSHGGFSLDIERKSIFVAGAAVFLLLAAAVRGFYFLPAAAVLWLVAAALWFYGIGRKAFQ